MYCICIFALIIISPNIQLDIFQDKSNVYKTFNPLLTINPHTILSLHHHHHHPSILLFGSLADSLELRVYYYMYQYYIKYQHLAKYGIFHGATANKSEKLYYKVSPVVSIFESIPNNDCHRCL